MIFKIAKTELRNLFYSPVAWFLSIVFFIQCAIFYTNAIGPLAKWQEIALENNPKFKNWGDIPITPSIFLGPDGIFANVLQNLYLFVPLLTMGLISREINNGTIKLLYSSPVKLRQIVLGKYLAIMLYNLLLVLIVGVFILTGIMNILHADYGLLLSALLGFYLLVCAYSAIGLFLSSLSTYQIVSAIGTFLVIFVLSRIGVLWQKYDFIRDLTYFLSMQGRTSHMLKGLIVTKDVLYFLAIVIMFVAFTILKLKGNTESIPWYIRAGRYALVIIIVLAVGYVGSKPAMTGYWDTTAQNTNTLHPRTQKIVKELDKDAPLEVTLYTNILGSGVNRGFPESRNAYLTDLWEPYLRFKPDIHFNYVYYYDHDSVTMGNWLYRQFPGKNLREIAQKMAEGYDTKLDGYIGPDSIRKMVNLVPEKLRLVMQLKYKGRTTFLRTFDDNIFWPSEQQVAAALKRLEQAQLPKVLFVTNDLERNIYKSGEREYSGHSIDKGNRPALINSGFDVDTISLETSNIPNDVTALVLADPKTQLSPVSMAKLTDYIDKGGNMLILGEPGKQDMLNPLLQHIGIQLSNGILVQPTKNEMPHMLMPFITDSGLKLSEEPLLFSQKRSVAFKETEDSMKILMPGAVAISYATNGTFAVQPLAMVNNRNTWLKMGTLVTDSAEVVYMSQEGDVKGAFATAVSLTRKVSNKEQRIVVTSDADFLSNLRASYNFFGIAIYSWLDNNKFPIYTPRDRPKDNLLKIGDKAMAIEKIVYIWIIPGLMLVFGTVLLIRRKRQ